jgi:predicted component of type VI protein secretion system
MMHQENIMESGHLQLAKNALDELEDLHNDLLDQEATYRAAVIQLAPSLNILKSKTNRPTMSDIEACLVLLYQIMLLKLQKKPISTETEQVQKQVTKLLQYLSKTYKEQ